MPVAEAVVSSVMNLTLKEIDRKAETSGIASADTREEGAGSERTNSLCKMRRTGCILTISLKALLCSCR